jgi:ApaG protein
MKQITVNINVKTSYLPEQSVAKEARFLWSYEIRIENQSSEIIQLLNRFWKITDLTGRIEEVRGPGVIGLQPIIKPTKPFTYTSFCQLATPQGTMEGHYEMQTLEEERFTVQIPKFILTSPVSEEYRSKLH